MMPGLPTLYAHRGAAMELPENTMPAFARALEVGATALETDVHLTRDGHVVIAHDDSGARSAGVPIRIRDATLAEVRDWNVGAKHAGAAGKRFGMPALEEMLAEITGVPINIDIKRHDRAAARAVVDVVRKARAQDRVLLTSFDAATLAAVRALHYEGDTGLSRAEVIRVRLLPSALLRAFPLVGRAVQVPPRVGPIALDSTAFIAKVHALGLAIHYWTINEPSEAERLLRAGADGIMTDDPAKIAPVFERFRIELDR